MFASGRVCSTAGRSTRTATPWTSGNRSSSLRGSSSPISDQIGSYKRLSSNSSSKVSTRFETTKFRPSTRSYTVASTGRFVPDYSSLTCPYSPRFLSASSTSPSTPLATSTPSRATKPRRLPTAITSICLKRLFSDTRRKACNTIIPSSIMTDRDILPDNIKPSHYGLTITNQDFKNWTFEGLVTIDVEVVNATKEIVINALALKLKSAKITLDAAKASQSLESTTFSYDEKKQRAKISFDQEIPLSKKAQLTIAFEGVINHDMAGYYRSQYKPTVPAAASVPRDEEFHYMFSTQFEACDARQAFPCFDEPKLKATFDFSIEIPEDQVALSNMPVKEEKKSKDGWKLVSFDTTPLMSTYLLAWAVGDFEYIEAFTNRKYNGKQIPVRVYTTRGLKEQGQWALEHAPKTIDLFSEIFEIDYPLPKSDLLAVHEFTHGAMENWGLVTYRTTAVLYDDKKSDAKFKNRVAYVVAHELAHQWFGNLVTMDWWDELWLNESFATWAGWYAVNEFHPDWEVWAQFVNEGMEMAFKLDSIRSSHPIHVPVKDALDVNQIFDHISYLKGCSTLRMLVNHLGTKAFLKGVAEYLQKHAYGNAKTEALWAALSRASGQDVNALMGPWIEKIGHPVLTVAEEPGQITVKQSRFLATGDVKPEDDETTWWVPLALQGKEGVQGVQTLALTSKEDTIRGINDDFYKLNSNATGFYRVNYPPPRLEKLSTQLHLLGIEDKIATIGSAAQLAFAGDGTTPALLSFIEGFKEETNGLVWDQALDSLATVKGLFGDDEQIKAGLDKFTITLISGAVEKLGWEFPEGEDYLTGLLRKRLLISAGAAGHSAVTEKALQIFNTYKASPEEANLHPNLRVPVFRVAVKSEPSIAHDVLKREWYTTTSVDGKMVCLSALGHIRDPQIIQSSLLPFIFNLSPPAHPTEAIPSGDAHFLADAMAHNSVARPLLWKYMRENWDAVVAKMANPVVLDRFVRLSLSQFADSQVAKEIEETFKNKDTAAFDRTLEQVKEKILGRAAYKKRDAEVIKEWLVAKGYVAKA